MSPSPLRTGLQSTSLVNPNPGDTLQQERGSSGSGDHDPGHDSIGDFSGRAVVSNLTNPAGPSGVKPPTTNCQVVIRVRPANPDDEEPPCITWDSGEHTVPPFTRLTIPDMDRAYQFDALLPPTASQKETYNAVCAGMLETFLEGFNCCVLAYGQTGSGKSYTMGTCQLDRVHAGVIPRALHDLFQIVETKRNRGWDIETSVTYIEIHNEEIKDLLNPGGNAMIDPPRQVSGRSLGHGFFSSGLAKLHSGSQLTAGGGIRIIQNDNNTIQMLGVKQVSVDCETAAMDCLKAGCLYRTTGSNKLNLASSRSHAIYTINLTQSETSNVVDPDLEECGDPCGSSVKSVIVSKLHFVDLAGSERVKRTQSQGPRLREGISINSGLLALSNVINALTDERQVSRARDESAGSHVPYRDSKLTRLLQDSLGGNSKTTMVACISASRMDFGETFSTIKYASRARHIKNTLVVNKDPKVVLIETLRARIAEMQAELEAYKERGLQPGDEHVNTGQIVRDLEREIEDLQEVVKEREQREADERAKRIGLEAAVVRYRNKCQKYRALIQDVKAHTGGTSSTAGDEETEDDGTAEEQVARTSELELTVERLQQELALMKRQRQTSRLSIVPEEFTVPPSLVPQNNKTLSQLLQMLKGLAAQHGMDILASHGQNVDPNKPSDELDDLQIDEAQIRQLLAIASDDDRTALLQLVGAIQGEVDASENLKSESDRLTATIKRTAELLNGTEMEKRHWEKIVSDLSTHIWALQRQLKESEIQKMQLHARIEQIDAEAETSEGVTLTPQSHTPIGHPAPVAQVDRQAESVRLYRKLEQETRHQQSNEGRLQKLQKELEEVNQKRDQSRAQIHKFEAALVQMKLEKTKIVKQIAEQDKKHKQTLAEKNRLISKLERQSKRQEEDIARERAEKSEKVSKIILLQKQNDELSKRLLQINKSGRGSSASGVAGPLNSSRRQQLLQVSAEGRAIARRTPSTTGNLSGGSTESMEHAKQLLHRGVLARMELQKAEHLAERQKRKVERLDHMINKLTQKVAKVEEDPQSTGQTLLALTDQLDALKSERTMATSKVKDLARTRNADTEKLQAVVEEAKVGTHNNPETYFEVFVAIYSRLQETHQKATREARRQEQELHDLRKAHARARQREEALLADFERQRIELLLAANSDKLVFMEGFKEIKEGLENSLHRASESIHTMERQGRKSPDLGGGSGASPAMSPGLCSTRQASPRTMSAAGLGGQGGGGKSTGGSEGHDRRLSRSPTRALASNVDLRSCAPDLTSSVRARRDEATRADITQVENAVLQERIRLLERDREESKKQIAALVAQMARQDQPYHTAGSKGRSSVAAKVMESQSGDRELSPTSRTTTEHHGLKGAPSDSGGSGRTGSRWPQPLLHGPIDRRRAMSTAPAELGGKYAGGAGPTVPLLALAKKGPSPPGGPADARSRIGTHTDRSPVSRRADGRGVELRSLVADLASAPPDQQSTMGVVRLKPTRKRSAWSAGLPGAVHLGTGICPSTATAADVITDQSSFTAATDSPPIRNPRTIPLCHVPPGRSTVSQSPRPASHQPSDLCQSNNCHRRHYTSSMSAEVVLSVSSANQPSIVKSSSQGPLPTDLPVSSSTAAVAAVVAAAASTPASRSRVRRRAVLLSQIPDAHSNYITALCTADRRNETGHRPTKLITGSLNEVKLWDLMRMNSNSPSIVRKAHVCSLLDSHGDENSWVTDMAPMSDLVIVAAVGHRVKIFDFRMPGVAHSWLLAPPSDLDSSPPPVAHAVTLMQSSSYDFVAASGSDHCIRLFDLRERGPLPVCRIPSSDEQYALAYVRGTADQVPSALVPQLVPESAEYKATMAMNGLVCGGEDGVVRLWNQGFTHLPSVSNLACVRALQASMLQIAKGEPTRQVLFCATDKDDALRAWIFHGDNKRPQVITGQTHPASNAASTDNEDEDGFDGGLDDSPVRTSGQEDFPDTASSDDDWRLNSSREPKSKSLNCLSHLEGTPDVVTGDKCGHLALWSMRLSENRSSEYLWEAALGDTHFRSQQRYELEQVSFAQDGQMPQPIHMAQRTVNKLTNFSVGAQDRRSHILFSIGNDTNVKIWQIESDRLS